MTTLDTLDWQPTLFADRLNRFNLMKLDERPAARRIVVNVRRNHGFEQVASALRPFLNYAGINASFTIGDYDDALTFTPMPGDLELVWLDYQRYAQLSDDELASWLCERLAALRASTDTPIFVADAPGDTATSRRVNDTLAAWVEAAPATAVIALSNIEGALGPAFYDERRAALTGTRYSDSAALMAARHIGLELIPAAFGPMIKAVALDLDNTLYSGVLGEDGISGVELTDGHHALQALLADLARRGLFLTILSRNEPEDVAALFKERSDFPLQPDLVADWQISWGDKTDGLLKAAQNLRIAPDAFLFVDDNIGELTAVGRNLPAVRLAFAGNGPDETTNMLRRYPALWPQKVSATDAVRVADAQANAMRERLMETAADPREYLQSLGVELSFTLNPKAERKRLAELSIKTNQFNLTLARTSAIEVDRYLSDPERRAVMVFLRDRLADSGSVGSILARRDGSALIIDELCISCRAMGRHLEDVMITEAIVGILAELPAPSVCFTHNIGPRNSPAREWLSAYTGANLGDTAGVVELAWDAERARAITSEAPVACNWNEN